MINDKKLKLSNGVEIPLIGLGTWLINNDDVYEVVLNALKLGYRHVDTAEAYENEIGVGKAIKESKIPREEIFLTTKLHAEAKTYQAAKEAIELSFKRLDVEYIDLMLIHSPQPWASFRDGNHYYEGNLNAWKALIEYYKIGKIKAIGVSNFEKEDIENLIKNSTVKPMVNQILTHITNTDFLLIKYCQQQNIIVEAYSPIAHGALLNNQEVLQIANKYHVTLAQLCIRYVIQLGLVALPKSSNISHIKNNLDVDFTIIEKDMETLKSLKKISTYGNADIFPCYNKLKGNN